MSVCLETIYLANILLHIDNVATIKVFPHVSNNCTVTLLALKVNPGGILRLAAHNPHALPHINTMVVDELSCLQKTRILPETVTGVVLKLFDSDSGPKDLLKFADRIVEIRK